MQVNVDELGRNIIGDAANEPSIAVDPTNPDIIVIGWRQFDSVESGLRQAGWAYSHDRGGSWTFPGSLQPGEFSSDPVLDADADGNFYYLGIDQYLCGHVFKSTDHGLSWSTPVDAEVLDKPWMAIDRTDGAGRGSIHLFSTGAASRSIDGGQSFHVYTIPTSPAWGTLEVAADGSLFVAGRGLEVLRSARPWDPFELPQFEVLAEVGLGGPFWGPYFSDSPNPDGLIGQVWIAADHSNGPTRGNVYLLASVDPPGEDETDVMFARSTDGGITWSEPVRINDDPEGSTAWQWFSTMSVAPNGRIDVIWNDTRYSGFVAVSELYYSYSMDGGITWSPNEPVSHMFHSWVGWPQQQKIGDYYDMVSDELGAHVAYAATFNGEQDIYYLWIPTFDCNGNGVLDSDDIDSGTSQDVNRNGEPDECEPDCNGNGLPDSFDIATGAADDANENSLPDDCEGQVLYVNLDASGANDGSSWTDAFSDLGDALISAVNAEGLVSEIWVAEGVYRPGFGMGRRGSTFRLSADVAVYGGFAGSEAALEQRDPLAHRTVLSGDQLENDGPDGENFDDNCYTVVDASGSSGELNGFVVRGGYFDFEKESFTDAGGGGLFMASGNLLIQNCWFIESSAHFYNGSAMGMVGGSATIRDTVFARNSLEPSGGAVLTIKNASATLERCGFFGNDVRAHGIVTSSSSNTAIIDTQFFDNVGGSAVHYSGGTHELVDCLFVRNSAHQGGALRVENVGILSLTGCLFVGNNAVAGGAISASQSNLSIVACDIIRNAATATARAGGLELFISSAMVSSSVFWGNSAPDGDFGEGAQIKGGNGYSLDVNYSILQGWSGAYGGVGNSGADPMFVDPLGYDDVPGTGDENLRLQPGSPGINRGDPGAPMEDGATDLDGNPRIQGCRMDMGPYESNDDQMPGDFDDNGRFDLIDVAFLQLCFDAPAATPEWADACLCGFDLNTDGEITGTDHALWVKRLTGP